MQADQGLHVHSVACQCGRIRDNFASNLLFVEYSFFQTDPSDQEKLQAQ